MISGTVFQGSESAASHGALGWAMWVAGIYLVGGAAIYAYVLALAANWAKHKKMFTVRKLILIWGWAHPAFLAGVLAVLLVFGPTRQMLGSRGVEIEAAMNSVKAIWVASIVVWIWILNTRVVKRRKAARRT